MASCGRPGAASGATAAAAPSPQRAQRAPSRLLRAAALTLDGVSLAAATAALAALIVFGIMCTTGPRRDALTDGTIVEGRMGAYVVRSLTIYCGLWGVPALASAALVLSGCAPRTLTIPAAFAAGATSFGAAALAAGPAAAAVAGASGGPTLALSAVASFRPFFVGLTAASAVAAAAFLVLAIGVGDGQWRATAGGAGAWPTGLAAAVGDSGLDEQTAAGRPGALAVVGAGVGLGLVAIGTVMNAAGALTIPASVKLLAQSVSIVRAATAAASSRAAATCTLQAVSVVLGAACLARRGRGRVAALAALIAAPLVTVDYSVSQPWTALQARGDWVALTGTLLALIGVGALPVPATGRLPYQRVGQRFLALVWVVGAFASAAVALFYVLNSNLSDWEDAGSTARLPGRLYAANDKTPAYTIAGLALVAAAYAAYPAWTCCCLCARGEAPSLHALPAAGVLTLAGRAASATGLGLAGRFASEEGSIGRPVGTAFIITSIFCVLAAATLVWVEDDEDDEDDWADAGEGGA